MLADMKELGPDSPKFHYEVGSWMKSHPVDILFTYGELAEQIARGAKRAGMKAEYLHFDENQSGCAGGSDQGKAAAGRLCAS